MSFTPNDTPTVIRNLILTTVICAIGSSLINPLFSHLLEIYGPQEILSLSWWGVTHFLIWQPISYLFVLEGGISFFFLLILTFEMYLLWIIGTQLVQGVGGRSFLRMYLLSGLIGAFAALLLMPIMHSYPILAGPAPAILALIVAWSMQSPNHTVLLFFMIPVRAKWLSAGLVGGLTLINLATLDLVHLALYLGGAFTGYFYALIAWELPSPYPFTHNFDKHVIRLSQRARQKLLSWFSSEDPPSKIVDFRTGKSIDPDEQFIDRMLEKISKQGESSLSWRERRRMQKISKKKQSSK